MFSTVDSSGRDPDEIPTTGEAAKILHDILPDTSSFEVRIAEDGFPVAIINSNVPEDTPSA